MAPKRKTNRKKQPIKPPPEIIASQLKSQHAQSTSPQGTVQFHGKKFEQAPSTPGSNVAQGPGSIRTVSSSQDSTPLTQRSSNAPPNSSSSSGTSPDNVIFSDQNSRGVSPSLTSQSSGDPVFPVTLKPELIESGSVYVLLNAPSELRPTEVLQPIIKPSENISTAPLASRVQPDQGLPPSKSSKNHDSSGDAELGNLTGKPGDKQTSQKVKKRHQNKRTTRKQQDQENDSQRLSESNDAGKVTEREDDKSAFYQQPYKCQNVELVRDSNKLKSVTPSSEKSESEPTKENGDSLKNHPINSFTEPGEEKDASVGNTELRANGRLEGNSSGAEIVGFIEGSSPADNSAETIKQSGHEESSSQPSIRGNVQPEPDKKESVVSSEEIKINEEYLANGDNSLSNLDFKPMEQYASAELPSGDESVTFFKGLSQIDNSAEALKQASFDRSLSQTPTGEVTLPDPDQKESHGLNEKIGSPEKPLTLCGTPIDLEGAEEQRGPKVEGEPRTVRFFEEDERESLSNEGYSHAKKCLGHLCQEGNEDEIEPNVLQIYLSYFDLNQNGKLDPIDTWRALRRIGFSIWISIIISIIAHIIGSSISRKGKWFIPDIFGRLQVTIPRESLTKRSGLLSTFAFKLQSDQNLALSYERLGPREIWQLTHKQINSEGNRDFRALFRLILQYILVVSLTWDLNVSRQELEGVSSGELLFIIDRKNQRV